MQAGFGVGFISRQAVETELAAGHARRGARPRARPGARHLHRPRCGPRGLERRAGVRRVRAGAARARDRPLGSRGAARRPRRRRDRAAAARRRASAGTCWRSRRPRAGARSRPTGSPSRQGWTGSSPSAAAARSTPRKAASAASALPLVSVPTTYSGAEWTAFFGVRTPDRRQVGGGAGARLAAIVYEPELTLDLPRAESGGTAHERARALRRGALRGRARGRHGAARPGSTAGSRACSRTAATSRLARGLLEGGERRRARRWPSAASTSAHAMAQAVGGALRLAARRDERALPAAGDALQRAGRPRRDDGGSGRAGGGARPPRPASSGCATSACPRRTSTSSARRPPERPGAKANPRPGERRRGHRVVPLRLVAAAARVLPLRPAGARNVSDHRSAPTQPVPESQAPQRRILSGRKVDGAARVQPDSDLAGVRPLPGADG